MRINCICFLLIFLESKLLRDTVGPKIISVSFKENADKDITYLKSKDVLYLNSYATAQNCFDELVEKFSLGDYSAADALKIASVCYSLKKISFSAANPFTVADSVSPTLAAKIKENIDI